MCILMANDIPIRGRIVFPQGDHSVPIFGSASRAIVAELTSVMEAANENAVSRITVEGVKIVIGQTEIIEIGRSLLLKITVLAPDPLPGFFSASYFLPCKS